MHGKVGKQTIVSKASRPDFYPNLREIELDKKPVPTLQKNTY